nr:hypothetical protein [Tanacetum cinerariifolium]
MPWPELLVSQLESLVNQYEYPMHEYKLDILGAQHVRESSTAAAARQPVLDVATVDATLDVLRLDRARLDMPDRHRGRPWTATRRYVLSSKHIKLILMHRILKMPPNRTVVTTTPTTDAQIKALIAQEVATALAEYETTRSRNSGNNHDSGTGVRRQSPTTRECTYNDFLKCQPMNIKGTEGVVGLTQWLKRWNLYSILGTAQSHVK